MLFNDAPHKNRLSTKGVRRDKNFSARRNDMTEPVRKVDQDFDIFPPSAEAILHAHIDEKKYKAMYARSVSDPDGFWGEMAQRLDWFKKPSIIKNTSFEGDVSIKWYEDGVLNACYNCVDRHLPKRANQTALTWEGDNPAD